MSTPEERLKIWREEQEAKTAEGRRRIWEREQSRRRLGPRLTAAERREQEQRYKQLQPSPAIAPRGHGTLKNLGLGAEQTVYGEFVPSALSGLEALGSAMTGDFGPAREIGELTLRGAGQLLTGGAPQMGIPPMPAAAIANAEAMERISARRQAERQGDPIYETVSRVQREVEAEAAQDPSRRGRIERGVGRYGTAALPAVATGIATGGSVPAMAAVSGLQTLNAPENIPLAVGLGAIPVPAGRFVAPILRRIRGARGAAAEAEAAGTAVAREALPVTARPAVEPLQSVFAKLGTDNIDQIGAMIANANRRLGKKRTPAQLQSSIEDYNALKQLTPEENRALGQVLPMRDVFPVRPDFAGTGPYARDIQNIPMSEFQNDPQLAANLRHAMEFFDEQGRLLQAAEGAAETGLPATIEAPSISGATPGARAASAGVTGPRAEAAALDIGADAALVQPAEKTGFLQALSAFRKAGLLRVTSHAKNIGGVGPWQVFEEAARIPGAILDIVLSPATGRRTYTGPSFGAVARSGYAAATKGVKEAWQVIRRGVTDADIERLGLHREVNTGSKILDTYINGTFRFLAAEDRIFRVYALRRSLEDRARSLALTEIKQGKIPRSQLGQRTRELVKAPPEDMAASAALDAEVATFNNQNLVSSGLNAAKGALEQSQGGRVANFAIDNVVPFAKTPTNVIGAMLEASPLGYGKNAYQIANAVVKKSFTAEQQRAFAQTFGRATAGSGLVALGYVGYRDGWLTGMQEDEPGRRARDTAMGRIPGAILVNGSWHSIAGLAPWGSLIVLGATLTREAEQEQKKAKEQGREAGIKTAIATAAPKAIGQAVLEQPLLSGTKQIIEGLEQPGTFGAKALGGIVGSYVPGHVSDIGQLIDYGVQREAQTFPQRIAQRIPGVRQLLPERQDVLGRPQEAPFPLNPARSQTAQQAGNPLFAELVRHDIGISGFEKKPDETDEQLRRRKTEFGKLYIPYGIQLVSSPQYQRASDEIQQGAIKNLDSRAKTIVEKNRQRTASGPLSPAALVGAAIGAQARERAKKNAGRK